MNEKCHARSGAALLLLCALAAAGCNRYHVYQVGGTRQREQGNQPSTEWKHKTLHSFLWGFIRQDLPVADCQMVDGSRFGIEEIKVETNFGGILASTVSLGIWSPVKVSWRCARPPVVGGTLR
jgi:hypothetical protein